ncbi:MAG: LacI family DNA-binding transcriptional regulator [Hyphomicrobiales bacterium]|nr:LacI family DNA-binding transcriptional regulator [Hyphomicrobiales bacterium]MDE2114667.1 LacI family DNA-binding transcriptional regulator [Hyphomicrobiales bacterium]
MALPPRATRIADVAALAGVSTATVSRTLANPEVVSPQMREKVMAAVRQTSYTRNIVAANLRSRQTMLVLVVVPDIANPFFAEVLRGIDKTLSGSGYGIIIGNLANSAAKEAHFVDLVFSGQVDGVLLLCGHVPQGKGRQMDVANVPLVAVCEFIPHVTLPQVGIDNQAAAQRVAQYLVGLGHKRFAYISGPASNILDKQRDAGFGNGLKAAGIRKPHLRFEGDFTFQSGALAATEFLTLKQRPTAIFAANDEMAIGFLKTVQKSGVKVPRDVSVVGFDDIEYSEYCEPTLTTVHQPRSALGAAAARLLLDCMQGHEEIAKPRSQYLEAPMVERLSSAVIG